MHWILFLLAAGCFIIVINATSTVLLFFALLATLVLMFAGVITLASTRIQGQSRNEAQILSPEELRALRNKSRSGNTTSAGSSAGLDQSAPVGTATKPEA